MVFEAFGMTRKDFFDYYFKKKYRFLFRWIDIRKISVLKKIICSKNNSLKVLDVGSGDAGVLKKCGFKRFFVGDINFALLKLCNRKSPIASCCQFDADKSLPFKDGVFDVVVSIDSIEHMKFPRNLVGEFARVLKTGGVLVIFTPPYDSVQWVVAEKIHKIITQSNADHISPFTRESLRFLLKTYFPKVHIRRLNFGLTMCGIARKNT